MDEDELARIGMEVILRPVTDIAEDVLGLAGGDWLHEKRARNRAKLRGKTEEILRKRGADLDDDPSPTILMPLLGAAQDEGREELLDLWAKLLASSMDPKRRGGYRREFVDIVKQLEPIDAVVLPMLLTTAAFQPSRREFVAKHLNLNQDMVDLALRNLKGVDLIESNPAGGIQIFPQTTPLGRQLLSLVAD